jgi:hypothetical protein
MIYKLANELKYNAIKHPMVYMAAFGSLTLFDDKSKIAYPYVNFDVVSSKIVNSVKTYTIRMYVCDRNEPYVAYNKTETIADDLLKDIEIETYTVNYFTLQFKDIVNGVFIDFDMQIPMSGECSYDSLLELPINDKYELLENGDLVKIL